MTALGKILVFFNLIFSLLIGALVVMVFIARTNWKEGFDRANNQLTVARTALTEEQTQSASLRDERDKLAAKLGTTVRDRDAAIKNLEESLAAAKSDLVKLQGRFDSEITNSGSSKSELQRIQDERKTMLAQVADLQGKLRKLTTDVADFRDKAVSSQLAYNSEHQRNLNLLGQLEQLNRQIQALKASGGTSTTVAKPMAPEDLRGSVTAVGEGGLMTVNVGSDAGLVKDNTLYVFRRTPTPQYLGTLQILNTRPHEAVGRFTAANRRVPAQTGDEVAATIVGGGR